MMMGSQLLVAASQFGITDVDFSQDLENFTRQCIFYDLLLGKYSWGELANSSDIWGFVSANASPARAFKVDGDYQTCKEGVITLQKNWNEAIDHAAGVYGARFFGQWQSPTQAKAQLLKALPITYEYFTGMSTSANKVMQQNMMANLIRKAVGSNASMTNASAAAQEFAIQRSDAQMRASLQISGQKAGYWLSLTQIVLEGVLFGAFVLLFPLFLLPKGMHVLKHYLLVLLTLEMIPPMFAITHLIISTAAASYGAASIYDPSGSGLNLATQLGLATIHQDMAAIAGRVSLALPFITYALVAGSGYAFMQFANSVVAGPAESAAGVAAGELTTGNYSFGNTTLDTSSIANSSRYQHNQNVNVHDGLYTHNDPFGATITHTAGGREIYNAGGALSNIGSTVRLSETLEESHSIGLEQSLSASNSQAQARAESMTQALRDTLELQEIQGQSTTAGDNYSRDENIQNAQSISQTSQILQDFAKTHNLNDNQTTQIIGEASANVGIGIPGASSWFNAQASISAKTLDISETQYQEAFSAAQKIAENEEFQESLRAMQSVGHTENLHYTDDESQRLSENISNSLDKAQTARTEMTRSLQEVEAHREALNRIQSNRAQYDVALEQAFYEWLPDQSLGSTEKMGKNSAQHMITRDPSMLGEYMQRFVSTKADPLLQTNIPDKESIEAKYATQKLDMSAVEKIHADANAAILGKAGNVGLSPDKPLGDNLSQEVMHQIGNDTKEVENRGEALANAGEPFKEDVAKSTENPPTTAAKNLQDTVSGWWDKTTGLTFDIGPNKNKPK